MRRAAAAKFPFSAQLFRFCQKVLIDKKQGKIHDQDVGSILGFNPSDCSHWKRGEKNIKSVFALSKIADALEVEDSLVHDVASGVIGLDEAYFEYKAASGMRDALIDAGQRPQTALAAKQRIEDFVSGLQAKADFRTPPLYLPEIFRFFPFVSLQQADMMDRLSRILRVKPGQYAIQYKKGDLKAQTRMSIAFDLARVILEGERERFPELGEIDKPLVYFEEALFAASLLLPKSMVVQEIGATDVRKNFTSELASVFWVPKTLLSFQLRDILRTGTTPTVEPVKSADTEAFESPAPTLPGTM